MQEIELPRGTDAGCEHIEGRGRLVYFVKLSCPHWHRLKRRYKDGIVSINICKSCIQRGANKIDRRTHLD